MTRIRRLEEQQAPAGHKEIFEAGDPLFVWHHQRTAGTPRVIPAPPQLLTSQFIEYNPGTTKTWSAPVYFRTAMVKFLPKRTKPPERAIPF